MFLPVKCYKIKLSLAIRFHFSVGGLFSFPVICVDLISEQHYSWSKQTIGFL